MVRVQQHLAAAEIGDLAAAVHEQLALAGVGETVRPGMRVALALGSRGIARIDELAAAVVAGLNARGAHPFIVPAMGSHGGATAQGQLEVLARLGITEERVGCPIRSSMEVVEIGALPSGLPVRIDRHAHEADGIVVVNRVKPHTSFRGPSESGLVKMIAVGLGKQQGADSCHAQGFGHMAENIVAMAEVALAREKILFGVAVVENALDRPMTVAAVPAREIVTRDRELLVLAKANMPRIPFDPLDVLVVDRIGKEFSGTGMDPNVTGRHTSPWGSGGAHIERLAVLDVTDATHGNGVGIGVADFTTRRLVDRLDLDVMYANALTSTGVTGVRVPATLPTEREAIQAAVKTCGTTDPARVRLARVRNTLHLRDLFVSEALLPEARARPAITVLGEPEPMRFDEAGRLANRWEATS
jgi:hypothetical protein